MNNNQEAIEKYKSLGIDWVSGKVKIKEIEIGGKTFKFGKKQIRFINELKARYCLARGGFGSGKTLALILKLLLFILCFPGNRILLGRKTISDLERAFLPDLFEIVPKNWYKYKVKEGLIKFFNGSEIIMFGLDSLQSGSASDIKKAQQKLKSLNIGAYFIDQLEEVEEDVIKVLDSRLRRSNVPIRQGNSTSNPADFWAYEYFIGLPKINKDHAKKVFQIRMSMMDNKTNLPPDYIEDQLNNTKEYVNRFVYGYWPRNLALKSSVIDKEYQKKFKLLRREPERIEEGCEIYVQPDYRRRYQMGIDPSEGAIDPSSISIVDDIGRKCAKFNKMVALPELVSKVEFLYNKYNKAFMIPEVNDPSILEGIRNNDRIDENDVYQRVVFDYREKKETKKLGWKTNYASKKVLISNFQELCRKNFPKIYDKGTIEEFGTFVWSNEVKKKGAGALGKYHDDDVMSTFLAYWGLVPKEIEGDQLSAIKKEVARGSTPKKRSFI